jgi:environmental stress-induced protein Ves
MRILRAADHKKMPWKNGGGVTTEIAVFPADAGLEDFLWRVSTARVEQNGPFSIFPGVDRSLSLLEGDGITLKVQGRIPFGMTRRYEPLTFPADVPTEATLFSGPITDLNVMTRRGVFESDVQLVRVSGKLSLDAADEVTLLIADGKGLKVTHGGEITPLERGDVLLLEPGDAATMTARPASYMVAVTILAVKPE